MALGFALAFLGVLGWLMIRFSIPRADAETLKNLRWAMIVFPVMLAFVGLLALSEAAPAAEFSKLEVVRSRAALGGVASGSKLLVVARVASAATAGADEPVAWERFDETKRHTPPLAVALDDGGMTFAGDDYEAVGWSVDRSKERSFLRAGDAVTVLAVRMGPDGARAERVFGDSDPAPLQRAAKADFFKYLVITAAALGLALVIPLLMFLGARRRRRELGSGPAA